MSETVKITCHGCKKKVNLFIKKPFYLNKNINRIKNGNPVFPAFGIAKISIHSRGLLKGRCNRSGKVFKIKGKYVEEDMSSHNHFVWDID